MMSGTLTVLVDLHLQWPRLEASLRVLWTELKSLRRRRSTKEEALEEHGESRKPGVDMLFNDAEIMVKSWLYDGFNDVNSE